MPTALNRIVIGFLAGVIAVLVFHQGMYLVMKQLGVPLSGAPWNFAPAAAARGLPTIVNQAFWGGLWGIAFALLHDRMPGDRGWLKGLVFGMLFPMLLGSWLVVALLKGQPILGGLLIDGNILRLRNGFLLNGVAFGIGLGLVYPALAAIAGKTSSATR